MTLLRTHRYCSQVVRSLSRAMAAMLVSLAALPAAAQTQVWIQQIGTNAGDAVHVSAPESFGGVYIGGSTAGNLGGPNAGEYDAWLARYDSAGSQLWIRQFGSVVRDYPTGAAPDGAGGAYVGGYTYGSLGGPSAGFIDAWLAHYDGAGNQLWIRQLGTSLQDTLTSAAPDGSGGVYVSGFTWGNLGGPNAGFTDAWLARYDNAGSQIWIRQFGTRAGEQAYAAAPDGSGGVIVGGTTNGNLGGPNAGNDDAWLARYDSLGNPIWVRQLGTSGGDYARAAATDGSGGVIVSGTTAGNFGGSKPGGLDAWVARYDGAGNKLWVRQLGSSDSDWTNAAAPDGSGGVYVSGGTHGNLSGPNAGKDDAWLARFDGAGDPIGTAQLGTAGNDRAKALAPDGAGGMYISGDTAGSLGGSFAGGFDVWLARYRDLCGAVTVYCTAKPNSLGCVPSIESSGTPSVSAGSGFTVRTSNVLDRVFGLYFYSKSGPSNAPFQGGILCAQPPLTQTTPQDSGGTLPCTGVLQIDFNAWAASGKDPALLTGQQVWIQTWSRDPGFAPPNNTSLSDAVTFTLCP
jgi:catechol 2,3-dioxygenase-like lactoylglutathione lyase family enzyme